MTLTDYFEWNRMTARRALVRGAISEEEFGSMMNDIDGAEADYIRAQIELASALSEIERLREQMLMIRKTPTTNAPSSGWG